MVGFIDAQRDTHWADAHRNPHRFRVPLAQDDRLDGMELFVPPVAGEASACPPLIGELPRRQALGEIPDGRIRAGAVCRGRSTVLTAFAGIPGPSTFAGLGGPSFSRWRIGLRRMNEPGISGPDPYTICTEWARNRPFRSCKVLRKSVRRFRRRHTSL